MNNQIKKLKLVSWKNEVINSVASFCSFCCCCYWKRMWCNWVFFVAVTVKMGENVTIWMIIHSNEVIQKCFFPLFVVAAAAAIWFFGLLVLLLPLLAEKLSATAISSGCLLLGSFLNNSNKIHRLFLGGLASSGRVFFLLLFLFFFFLAVKFIKVRRTVWPRPTATPKLQTSSFIKLFMYIV